MTKKQKREMKKLIKEVVEHYCTPGEAKEAVPCWIAELEDRLK